jgi:hypothetical protein
MRPWGRRALQSTKQATRSTVKPEIPADDAVMVADPELMSDEAVTSPASFTVATVVSLDVQVTSRVRFS